MRRAIVPSPAAIGVLSRYRDRACRLIGRRHAVACAHSSWCRGMVIHHKCGRNGMQSQNNEWFPERHPDAGAGLPATRASCRDPGAAMPASGQGAGGPAMARAERGAGRMAVLSGLAALCLVIVGICYWIGHRRQPTPAPEPLRVQTMTVAPHTVPDIIETSGIIVSPHSVDVRPQTDGVLQSVLIHDGEQVRAGQLLFTIDPRPLRATLAQARAALARDQALAADAADTEARYSKLSKTGAVDPKTYVTAADTLRSLRGTVAVDLAQVEQTRLSLAYTEIRAPIDGRAGAIGVKPGNLVSSGSSTALLTINVNAPIDVRFALAHVQVDAVRAARAGRDGLGLTVLALDAVSASVLDRGRLAFLDNAFDSSSGTLELRARFANAGATLWPGQFVSVRVILAEDPQTLSVPEGALQQGQQGPYVYCVVNGRAMARPLTVARMVDGQAVISKGLRKGDTVILTVPNELRDGAAVQSNDLPARQGAAATGRHA
ncbi:efflux RND transporter periplasmic adaptor subunit [Xanthomonas translucens]|uniref:efflux RND transporter periplasmic adaptor subunit n=1 Tax=Xanthomonas campestris pv. translucens TaxID=343 RepID=UPI001F61CCBD|nr:efflux RND transporter periplasmic adaptor subunit [Xanthomonas translucens]